MTDPEVVEALSQIRDCLREILTQLQMLNHPPLMVGPTTFTIDEGLKAYSAMEPFVPYSNLHRKGHPNG